MENMNAMRFLPKRQSIKQPPFSRVREFGRTIYPSNAYEIPEKECIAQPGAYYKSNPLVFVGVDIVEFDERDPSTMLTSLPSIVSKDVYLCDL